MFPFDIRKAYSLLIMFVVTNEYENERSKILRVRPYTSFTLVIYVFLLLF